MNRHTLEASRLIDAHDFELCEDGIYLPKMKAALIGEYILDDGTIAPNRIVNEGYAYLLSTGLMGTSPQTAWYLALYSGNYTPTATLTAATFNATATEITSLTNGYSETTRPQWTPGAVADGQVDNVNARANFTIATTSSVTVRGAAMLSRNVRGSGAGVLLSAARFPNDRIKYAGEIFTLGYRVRLRDV